MGRALSTRFLAAWALTLLFVSPATSQESVDRAAFTQCLNRLRLEAEARGISGLLYQRLTARLSPDARVLALLDRQPEFVIPIWQYLANLVDRERIQSAQHQLAEQAPLLSRIERQYGVEAELLIAFWAIESNFGRNLGRFDLVQSLATLSCFGRRQDYFRGEFLTLAEIIARGEITNLSPRGSWAGAFGQTQFMPSTFARYAVDGDGDGVRDLYQSLPDIFASTANFLKQLGWRYGEPWGIEVRLPVGWTSVPTGRKQKRPTREWLAMGLTRADGQPWVREALPEEAALLLPAGSNGPAILLFRNYEAIYRYNAAESYALAVGLLFWALRDSHWAAQYDPKQPFRTPWPTDDPPLTRSEISDLQERLEALGFATGGVDGALGNSTREALRQFQVTCLGITNASGWPDRATRNALMTGSHQCAAR